MIKKELQLLEMITDSNNPKFELNCAFFSKEGFATATNAKHICLIKLKEIDIPKKDTFIRKDVLKIALKYCGKLEADFKANTIDNCSFLSVYPLKKPQMIFGHMPVKGSFPDSKKVIGDSIPEKEVSSLEQLKKENSIVEILDDIEKTLIFIFDNYDDIYYKLVKEKKDEEDIGVIKMKFENVEYTFLFN